VIEWLRWQVFGARLCSATPGKVLESSLIAAQALADILPGGEDITMKHAPHHAIIVRLKRAHGHLAAVLSMLEEGRPCVDLAQQLHAVEGAISNAKRELIHDHIEHCLDDTSDAGSPRTALKELKQLAKYL
jgi:DNA-binding FrmR family transcriptional regulator